MGFEHINGKLYSLKIDFSGIYVIVYLYKGKHNILIDSAMNSFDIDSFVIPSLSELGISINDIDILLNTHTHGDHIGGHYRLKELNPNIKVITTELSKDKVENPLKYNIEIRKAFPLDSPPPSYGLKGVHVDSIIKEGDLIESLQVVFTPGHDDDCVSFYELETKTLLTGDSIQQNGTNTQGMALYMYLDQYVDSLLKLQKMDIERIVAGHPFNPFGGDIIGNKNVKEFIKYNIELVRKYDSIVSQNKDKDIHEIVRIIIKHFNGLIPEYLFLGLYTIREHLNKVKGDK